MLIAADVAAADVHHVQRFDQAAFVRSTGCAFQPVSANSAEADLAAALRHLREGRGPVVLRALTRPRGRLSTPSIVEALESADYILAIGASTEGVDDRRWHPGEQRDAAPARRGPHGDRADHAVHAALVGDAALTARLEPRNAPHLEARAAHASDYQDLLDAIDPRRALDALDAALDERSLVVLDTGRNTSLALQHLTVTDPRRFALTLSFAAIGQGLPTAIGAAFAHPGSA